MADVQAVGKTGHNSSQNYSFRGIDATINAVGPAFRSHGVICLPEVESFEVDQFTTKAGGRAFHVIVRVRFHFTGPEGDSVTCVTMGESADTGDKAFAKAHSVAYRIALLQALCIPTDEPDPDATTYERTEVEVIPSAEAKTRLLAASNEDTAVLMWADRKNESIPLPELDALIRTARALMPVEADRD